MLVHIVFHYVDFIDLVRIGLLINLAVTAVRLDRNSFFEYLNLLIKFVFEFAINLGAESIVVVVSRGLIGCSK